MDDIQEKIAEIMADPEALSQVQNLGRMLGLGGDSAPSPAPSVPSAPSVPAVSNLPGGDLLSGETVQKLGAILPLLSQANREDDTTRLLAALRPFLGEKKQKKLETARKMLMLMKLLPVLKSGGLFELFS